MKSKKELLKIQNNKKDNEFENYVKLIDDAIKNNYPSGLDFDECPHVERIVCYSDVDISYYSGLEKELIKVVQSTDEFKKIGSELKENGYKYEFDSYVSYPNSTVEWGINLIIS